MLRHISVSLTPTVPTTDTRARILHATLRVIAAGGIAAVSNRRVAAEAGVALGSLTYHFPSQTALLRDSLLLYAEEEVARLGALAAGIRAGASADGRGGGTPSPEQAAAAAEQIVAQGSGRPEEIAELELHLHASRDPELHSASQRCFGAYEDFAAAALETLGVPEPERHARAVVALICGLGVRRLGTGEHSAEGTADALLTVLRGARAK
ncbi:MAG TPA: TetR family transcriptional regulator [Conexibacter sp.]|nr:TetR family transcriptional regulator [Conexibacter sp.]